MCIIELIFYALNESLAVKYFLMNDIGGSMIIHTFGAYFGLAVTYMISKNTRHKNNDTNMEASYESDVTAMIGTIFLWMFWPSFNGAPSIGNS